jgi:hypothetical protein
MMFILILFTYSWGSLVPVLLASVDGITSELLDAGVTLGNVDVEEDTTDGDTVDLWVVDEGDNWLVDAGEEESSAGVGGVEAGPGVDVVDAVDDVGIVVVEVVVEVIVVVMVMVSKLAVVEVVVVVVAAVVVLV